MMEQCYLIITRFLHWNCSHDNYWQINDRRAKWKWVLFFKDVTINVFETNWLIKNKPPRVQYLNWIDVSKWGKRNYIISDVLIWTPSLSSEFSYHGSSLCFLTQRLVSPFSFLFFSFIQQFNLVNGQNSHRGREEDSLQEEL